MFDRQNFSDQLVKNELYEINFKFFVKYYQ